MGGIIKKALEKGWEFMKKTLRIVVFCLVAVFALTACSTVKNDGQLYINNKLISFDCAGGQIPQSELTRAISESKNDQVTLPVAERSGYIFAGWVETSLEGTESNPIFSVVRKEVKEPKLYTAKWTLQEYNVNFVSRLVFGTAGGDVNDLPKFQSSTYTVETEIKIDQLQDLAGYEFIGWIEDGEGEGSAEKVISRDKGTVTGDKTVVALFRPNTYSISVDLDGGTLDSKVASTYVFKSAENIGIDNLVKEGYEFAGWLCEDGAVEVKDGSVVVNTAFGGDIALKASWKPVEYKVSITSKLLEGAGGDVNDLPKYADTSYTVETEIDLPALDSVLGYDFVGWIEEGDAESSAVKTVKLAKGSILGDKKLIALFKPGSYKISVDLDGGKVEVAAKKSYVYKSEEVIEIANPVKTGYEFTGWAFEDGAAEVKEGSVVINTAFGGNIALKAQWKVIEYPITYNEEGLIVDDLYVPSEDPEEVEEPAAEPEEIPTNPDYYNVTEGVSFIKPSREGFTFLGWVEKPEDFNDADIATLTATTVLAVTDPNYSIAVGTTGNKDLVAVWGRRVYIVSYNLKGGNLENSNPTQFLYEQDAFALNAPTREFYVFKGWKDSRSGKIYTSEFGDTAIDRNVTLVAQWEPVEYTISYDLDGGKFEGSYPVSYNYETKTFTIPTPVRNGYTFTGWAVSEEVSYDPVLFTLTFNIEGVDFTIKVFGSKTEWVFPVGTDENLMQGIAQYLGKEFPEAETTVNENIITLDVSSGDASILEGLIKNVANEAGFVLEYQKTQIADVGYDEITIYQGSSGNKAYKATWDINVYSIEYAEDEEYGPRIEPVVEVYEYPTKYTAEEIVEIKNPEKFGYDFMGWVLEDQEYTEAKTDLVLDKGSVGDRVYVPLFQLHNYNVVLELDGGSVEAPSTFTIEDENFTIGKAARDNYIFKGWLCEDGSIKTVVSVECAKGEDVVLKAIWEPIVYKISYELNDGTFEVGSADNVTSYSAGTEPFTLVNPIKESYEFAGWIIKGNEKKEYPVVDYTFDTSKGGSVTLVATWKEKEYKISYTLSGGSFEYADSNPSTFTNFEEDIELEAPTRAGYTFLGWVEVGKEKNRPVVDYVIKASELRSDVALKAMWKATSYTISYDLNGGYFSRGTAINATSYTIEDRAFVLANPVKEGYTFQGWVRTAYSSTDIPTLVLRVDTSKGGNLSYQALWKANSYTITYNLDGGSYQYGNSNPTTYTADSSFTLANPHKDGYTFLGWIKGGDSLERVQDSMTVSRGTTGNLTFYAIYEQTLVAVGEATKLQTQIIELGKNDIPRPDWVIKAPEESKYHYEKAYASGGDLITNLENASAKCREYLAAYLATEVSSVSKTVNGMTYNTQSTEVNTTVTKSEMVEYWEDANGGVWVLMRISK